MNNNIFKAVAFIIPGLALLGCSENSWNDEYLDGFVGGPSNSTISTAETSLTADDYSIISSLMLAQSKNSVDSAAARAIKDNMYFDASGPFPGAVAIPYYLASTSSNFFNFNNGSTVDVSYQEISGTPEEIFRISSAPNFILTSQNYQTVWASETDFIPSFAPSHEAEKYMPSILKAQYPDAEEGDYVVVTYNNSTQEPGFGSLGDGDVEITDAIKDLAQGDMLSTTAIVTALNTRGFILTDNGGSILYYNPDVDLSQYPVGSIVKVNGEVSAYNHGLQVPSSANISKVGMADFEYPEPIVYNASMIDAAVAGSGDNLASYVQIQGELSISGNYYNILIDGTEVQGSVYYPTSDIVNQLENGKSYIFNGYFTSFTSKYLYMVVTSATPLVEVGLTDAIKNLAKGDMLNATAVVTAQCSRGVILSDNAGSILYYNTDIDLSAYPVGTAVKISGEVGAYNHGLQLTNSATVDILGRIAYSYPDPTLYTSVMVEEAVAGTDDITAEYVEIQGALSISGNYYNVIIPGTEVQGSVYYPTPELQATLEAGVTYSYEGYFTSFTNKYFYMVVTHATPLITTVSYKNASTRAVTYTPAYSSENAVYYFNGSAWSPAENVTALNPTDYEAMGDSDNSITSPSVNLPLYMKANFPYAVEGDQKYVVYNITSNGCSCNLMVYDGNSWSINNNGLESLTAQFAKSNGSWKFSKYLGKAIFNLFTDNEIILDRTYMLVYGTAAATPVPTSNTYGYLQKTDVTPGDGVIVMANDANGFTFATTCNYNGTEYKAPAGKFVIRDSNGRYLYLQGTYASFNVRSDSPYIEDGAIADGYLFSATNDGNGGWQITNDRGEGNVRNIYFSTQYSNFAAYTSASDVDHFPSLYLLDE